jgi:hypothetical protein
MDVGAAEADELRDAQPGLDGEQEEGMVASARRGRPVRGREDGLDLLGAEERDEAALEALGGDGQHPLDERGMLGMAQRGVAEERADGSQARVAGAHGVAAVALEVVEEGADERRVEVREVEPRGRRARPLGGEPQEEPPGVAVGGDGLRAGLPLPDEPLGEERLEGRGERAHGRSPRWRSRRPPARASSSGAADRYQ